MKMRVLIFALMCMIAINTKSHSVKITVMDSVDWSFPPSILKDNSFYLLSSNGNVIQTGGYSKGKKNGLFLYFHEGKGLYKEENYSIGILDGFWKEYTIEGYKCGYYRKGKKNGQWTIHDRYKTETFEYKDNILNGSYIYKDTDGNQLKGYYKQGDKDGVWTRYLNNIVILEEVFIKGKPVDSIK